MKEKTGTRRKTRIIAAVSAILIVAGGTAGIFAYHSSGAGRAPQTAQQTAMPVSAAKTDNGTISAGGTVESGQLTDTLGLINTNVRLTVEAVLAESGDTVTAGTPLYQITEDSLAKAEKTLRSELQSAENALTQQKVSYQEETGKAAVLCESEQLLGDAAAETYEAGLAALDSSLQQAYSDYMDAQNTVNNTPGQISAKQSEMNAQQAYADQMQAEKNNVQQQVNSAKTAYSNAADNYNNLTAEYNAAAGVVRCLGAALGLDVSGITLAKSVTANIQQQQGDMSAGKGGASAPAGSGSFDGSGIPSGGSFSPPVQGKPAAQQAEAEEAAVTAAETAAVQSGDTALIKTLYETAYAQYAALGQQLADADATLKSAENSYRTLSDSLNTYTSAIKDAQNNVSALSKEISSLNSELSKAKSNLSKLRSEYNSLKASYETDQLELKHTLETDTAAGENAEYHYEITCATVGDELAEAQTAYDTAEENLRIFEEELADGYVYAKQDGTVYALSCKEGRSVNLNTAYVSYVDESSYYTTVELDQNDVTQVGIGDSVLIYSSETGTANGRITAIAAGESTSLADVRFNVTVTADEDAGLYYGESINVYFNAGDMKQSEFKDFDGSGSSEREKPASDGERPDFGGNMPEGFDPSNMPDFGRRKDD